MHTIQSKHWALRRNSWCLRPFIVSNRNPCNTVYQIEKENTVNCVQIKKQILD